MGQLPGGACSTPASAGYFVRDERYPATDALFDAIDGAIEGVLRLFIIIPVLFFSMVLFEGIIDPAIVAVVVLAGFAYRSLRKNRNR